MKRVFILAHDIARRGAVEYVKNAPDGHMVTIQEPTRNLEQNAAMWPILEAFSDQLEVPVNGSSVKLSREDWKDLLTANFEGEMRMAFFMGRVVMLGTKTSTMGKKKFSQFLEFLHATASEMGVVVYAPTSERAAA